MATDAACAALSGTQALSVIDPLSNGSSDIARINLNPLLGVLRSAYEQYQDVCHNREICLHLLKRSQKILVTIDSEIAKRGHPDGMKDNIDRLCG